MVVHEPPAPPVGFRGIWQHKRTLSLQELVVTTGSGMQNITFENYENWKNLMLQSMTIQNLVLRDMTGMLEKGAGSPCPAEELSPCSLLGGNAETPSRVKIQLDTLVAISTGSSDSGLNFEITSLDETEEVDGIHETRVAGPMLDPSASVGIVHAQSWYDSVREVMEFAPLADRCGKLEKVVEDMVSQSCALLERCTCLEKDLSERIEELEGKLHERIEAFMDTSLDMEKRLRQLVAGTCATTLKEVQATTKNGFQEYGEAMKTSINHRVCELVSNLELSIEGHLTKLDHRVGKLERSYPERHLQNLKTN